MSDNDDNFNSFLEEDEEANNSINENNTEVNIDENNIDENKEIEIEILNTNNKQVSSKTLQNTIKPNFNDADNNILSNIIVENINTKANAFVNQKRHRKMQMDDRLSTNITNAEVLSSNVFEDSGEEMELEILSANENNEDSSKGKKVPLLLSNVQTMYDINSERVKKRSEQMKKRKEKHVASPIISAKKSNENTPKKIISKKKFQEANENMENDAAHTDSKSKNASTMNLNEVSEYNEEEKAEVVVSDLECEIEENNVAGSTGSVKSTSFIPINNHLVSKKNFNPDNATPSYLMALYQDEAPNEDEQLRASSTDNINAQNTNSGRKLNFSSHNLNKNHNYIVQDVIEEETSENYTDSEFSSRKKSSFFFSKKHISNSNSERDSSYFISPINRKLVSPSHLAGALINLVSAVPTKKSRHSKSDVNADNMELHMKKENLTNPNTPHNINQHMNINNSNTNCFMFNNNRNKYSYHKNSKSDLVHIKYDIKKILENIQSKITQEKEEKLEKMKLRKNLILNNFISGNGKSKSYGYNNTILKMFTEKESVAKAKKLSICTDRFFSAENLAYKKLSPSGLTRALYYDSEYPTNENITIIKDTLEEEEEEYADIFENNEDEDNIVENKSIMEINENEEVNFENELNLQLEKNEINLDNPNQAAIEKPLEIVENHIFDFNLTPIEAKRMDSKIKHKKPLFDSEDMIISQVEKINVLGHHNTDSIIDTNFNINNNSFSVAANTSINKHNFEINSPIALQILNSKEKEKENTQENKAMYTNNYINNNINNISISIVSNTNSNSNTKRKLVDRSKNNSITNDIRKKYHYKTPSINLVNSEKIRSNSFSKNQMNVSILENGILKIMSHHAINSGSSHGSITGKDKKMVKNKSLAGVNSCTPSKAKTNSKSDLKQFLIYSESKPVSAQGLYEKNEKTEKEYTLSFNSSIMDNKERVNSESSVSSLIANSNKQIILEAMMELKFQTSSLDHQKFAYEKLYKSKAKFFSLLISIDSTCKSLVNYDINI